MIKVEGALSLDGRQWQQGLNKAESATGKFAGSIKGKLAGIFGIAAITAFAKSIIDLGGQINDMATRFGVSTTGIQEFRYAARQSGVDLEGVGLAMTKLSQAMAEVSSGSKTGAELAEVFARMGVSMEDIKNKAPEDVFKMLGEKLGHTNINARVTADMMDLLGKSGSKLVPMMKELGENIAKAHDEGQIISPEEIELLDKAGDKIESIGNRIKVLGAGAINLPALLGRLGQGMFDQVAGGDADGNGSFSATHAEGAGRAASMEAELARRKALNPKKAEAKVETVEEKEKREKKEAGEHEKSVERVKRLNEQAAESEERARMAAMSDEEKLLALIAKRADLQERLARIENSKKFTGKADMDSLLESEAETKKDIADTTGDINGLGKKNVKTTGAIQSDSLTRVGNFLGASGQTTIVNIAQKQLTVLEKIATNTSRSGGGNFDSFVP